MHLICHFPNIVSGLYLIIVWHMCAHLSLKFAAILAYLAYPWKHGDKYVPQTRVTFFLSPMSGFHAAKRFLWTSPSAVSPDCFIGYLPIFDVAKD